VEIKKNYTTFEVATQLYWFINASPHCKFINEWMDSSMECIHVKMNNFFNFQSLIDELIKIKKFLDVDTDIDTVGLMEFWNQFMSKNKAYHSWSKVKEIIKKIESDEDYTTIPTNSFEQAYIAYYAKNTLKDNRKYYDI
jgi:hypothetical protein